MNHSWVYLTILLLIPGSSEPRETLLHADAPNEEITTELVSIQEKTKWKTLNDGSVRLTVVKLYL